MDLMQAIKERHSVRKYTDKPIAKEVKAKLEMSIADCNNRSGLNIQLVTDEPKAFSKGIMNYGIITGVTDYIAMVGKNDSELSEKCGYYGEELVLKCQQWGLNTCWVGVSFKKIKTAFKIGDGEKLCCVIALGYGENSGTAHKSKTIKDVTKTDGEMPEWFKKGAEMALLAPTAINQQKFEFELKGGEVSARAKFGPYNKVDLGIVKYHFEVGAGRKLFGFR